MYCLKMNVLILDQKMDVLILCQNRVILILCLKQKCLDPLLKEVTYCSKEGCLETQQEKKEYIDTLQKRSSWYSDSPPQYVLILYWKGHILILCLKVTSRYTAKNGCIHTLYKQVIPWYIASRRDVFILSQRRKVLIIWLKKDVLILFPKSDVLTYCPKGCFGIQSKILCHDALPEYFATNVMSWYPVKMDVLRHCLVKHVLIHSLKRYV